jgi:predicted dehydrogenase
MIHRRHFLQHASTALMTSSLWGEARAAQNQKTLRLGLISGASYGRPGKSRKPGSHHGTAFATAFNGWDASHLEDIRGTFVKSARRVEGARVMKLWDPDPGAARALATVCGIEHITSTPEACCDGMDAVLIVDDGSGSHWRYADYPLRKGIPTFCDKPLAMTAREAAGIVRIAREAGTPFMSSSSLRFVPDIVELRGALSSLGSVHLAQAVCGHDLIYYGIHALSMIYAVLGGGAVSAVNVGREDRNIVRIRFSQGLDVVLIVADSTRMQAGYQLNLYGAKGWRTLTPDLRHLYTYLLETFIHCVSTGKEPYPIEQEVELIAALEASQRSLELGREVQVHEVM